ncbi:acyltransferase family protein [Pseudomonas asplenii]|uniref:acyltransferase family protein n=1 Tax=Pseudomonas asplenii TaxID=53407 RepID=UPI0012FE5554
MVLPHKIHYFFDAYHSSSLSASLILAISNITIFFQDWVLFLGIKDGSLGFASQFNKDGLNLYQGLLLPQAWTLGVELSFYLIAPFILPRKKILIAILLSSLALRYYIVSIGLGFKDPWTYRFFPTELALFLMGALSHQILMPLYKRKIKNIKLYSSASTWLLLLLVSTYFLIPIESELAKGCALILIVFALMPLAFFYQGTSKMDQWIGELSYPLYIVHMFVIYVLSSYRHKIGFMHDQLYFSYTCIALSIACSILINKKISTPMEKIRTKQRKQENPPDAA